MKIEYTIKGITLDVNELSRLHEYYEAACTAEFIMENYKIKDEDKAMEIGYEVRRQMFKYDLMEDEAIDIVLPQYGIKKRR